jgi:hypothetical protein
MVYFAPLQHSHIKHVVLSYDVNIKMEGIRPVNAWFARVCRSICIPNGKADPGNDDGPPDTYKMLCRVVSTIIGVSMNG